jgi:biopolymer transport protein ExbB
MATLLATPALFAAEEAVQLSNRIVDNPYSLEALWAQGDLVARGTLAILAVMSVATWYILICKLAEQHRLLRQARAANATFWQANSVAEGIAGLPTSSPFRSIATTGLKAAEDHEDSLIEKIDLHSWISMSIQRSVAQIVGQLQGGLAVLATVGSTAPFVGLFGTVWGIYHALTAIGIAGQASIDKVAGPVGEALIMTALGLAVAVPAVLGYNWLVRRNKTAIDGLRGFASDLHSVLLSGRGNKAQARTIQHKPAALG